MNLFDTKFSMLFLVNNAKMCTFVLVIINDKTER